MMLPDIALSVRQPWAWAIIHGGKDIENRTRFAITKGEMKPRRVAIHASKGMTKDEYFEAACFMRKLGVICPDPADLLRGGIIGSVDVLAVVGHSQSPWFFGPRGLVLANPESCGYIASQGDLGYFPWKPNEDQSPPDTPKWMIRNAAKDRLPPVAIQQALL